jgi:predicted TIM-barrel fold metal-dependent hydrolase
MGDLADSEYYQQVDLPVYREELEPVLPDTILDFHAHVWTRDHWRRVPWEAGVPGGKYMVVRTDYGFDALQADLARFFPTRRVDAVCFGYPIPSSADLDAGNRYLARGGGHAGRYPLMVVHKDETPKAVLEQQVREGIFFGYKVGLPWHGNDYGDVTVEDMLTAAQMELADELSLVVLLHLPRAGRLADPANSASLRRLAARYPRAQIVLAHCGRAYCPDVMRRGIGAVRDLDNVYFDVSMVQDPVVLQILFQHVDSRRVLFGSDLPVAAMRGRRVCVNDHWVDVLREPDQGSGYRVGLKQLRATFMVYEIIRAVRDAAEFAGLSNSQLSAIFFDNGMALLYAAMEGGQMRRIREHAPPA